MALQMRYSERGDRFYIGPENVILHPSLVECDCRDLLEEKPESMQLPSHVCFSTCIASCQNWWMYLLNDSITTFKKDGYDIGSPSVYPIPLGEGDGRVVQYSNENAAHKIHNAFEELDSRLNLVIQRSIEETDEYTRDSLKRVLYRKPAWQFFIRKLDEWRNEDEVDPSNDDWLEFKTIKISTFNDTRKLLSAFGLPPTDGTAAHAWGLIYNNPSWIQKGPTRGITITSYGIISQYQRANEERETFGEMVSKITQLYPGVSRNLLEKAQSLIDEHGKWWTDLVGDVPIANFDLRGARGRSLPEDRKDDILLHLVSPEKMPEQKVIKCALEYEEIDLGRELDIEERNRVIKKTKMAIKRERERLKNS